MDTTSGKTSELFQVVAAMRPYFMRGGVAILHGDCLDVLPLLPPESVDLVLTDPPYLVNYRGRWDGEKKAIVGDDDSRWVLPAFSEVLRVMKPDTLCLSFYGYPHADVFVGVWKAIGFRVVSHVTFVKRVWGLGRYTRGQHETAYLLAKGRPRIPEDAISDVIEWEREADVFHPNQKPLASLYPLLRAYAPVGGTVLDPFMGSGSTLRAAKDMGLKGVGIEIEGRYCRRAASRMSQELLFGEN
jgi:site-specific DNA-methyltransferase (adenine-specific)